MTKPTDPTFRNYSAEQAKIYATHRLSYPEPLYNTVLQHHVATGGQFDRLLDVGCGPGNATRDIALSFNEAIGVDPGESMIDTAKSLGGKTKSGKDINYVVSPAEKISEIEALKERNVDLLTVAMAVHWFDMPKFYAEAAKVLKPGGTLAFWTYASSFCDPATPNAEEVQKVFFRFERETLAPYEMKGNRLSRDMYDDLPMPWTVEPTAPEFPQSEFVKIEYDRHGKLSDGKDFFGGGTVVTLDQIEGWLGTASMVTRWRAAHPELVGTDQDCVRAYVRELRGVLGEVKSVRTGSALAMLLFKRS